MGRLLATIARLIVGVVRDLGRWGPAARVEQLPADQQRRVFDEHWRSGGP